MNDNNRTTSNSDAALYDMKNNINDILSIMCFAKINIKFNPYRDCMNVEIYHGFSTKFTFKAKHYMSSHDIVVDYNYLTNQINQNDEKTLITLDYCEKWSKISIAKVRKVLKDILNNIKEY